MPSIASKEEFAPIWGVNEIRVACFLFYVPKVQRLEDGTWFAEIPGFKGVWANGDSIEECRKELIDVLEEWLVLKLRDKDPSPTVDGLTIEIRDVAVA